MTGVEGFVALIAETGIGLPRGVLGAEARAHAEAIASGASDGDLVSLRAASSAAVWEELRLAMGASLERAAAGIDDPRVSEALEWTLSEDPANPFALALADEAARLLAAALVRNADRLRVMEGRLGGGGSPDGELALGIGAIVIDLLDLDPDDYEGEISEYIGAGESDAARRQLVRATGDADSREWARQELRGVAEPDAPVASRALQALASGDPPEDPADDAVWTAAMLALVEQAVEFAIVAEADGGLD